MCVCVCVCEREREREGVRVYRVCVCEREKERVLLLGGLCALRFLMVVRVLVR